MIRGRSAKQKQVAKDPNCANPLRKLHLPAQWGRASERGGQSSAETFVRYISYLFSTIFADQFGHGTGTSKLLPRFVTCFDTGSGDPVLEPGLTGLDHYWIEVSTIPPHWFTLQLIWSNSNAPVSEERFFGNSIFTYHLALIYSSSRDMTILFWSEHEV